MVSLLLGIMLWCAPPELSSHLHAAFHHPFIFDRPICSLKNVDLCDDEKKALIKKYQDMTLEALKEEVATQEGLMEDAEKNFHEKVQELQATYEKLNEEKNDAIAKVKASGMGLMKSVIKSKEVPEAKEEL